MTQRDLSIVWASTGTSTEPSDVQYQEGWLAEIPTFQEFNWVLGAIDGNVLHLAEEGAFDYDPDISYKFGALVKEGEITYHCYVASQGFLPSANPDRFSRGRSFGLDTGYLRDHGLRLNNVGGTTQSSTLWETSDITVKGGLPIIAFETNAANKNWGLANSAGEMLLIDLGTTTVADNRNATPGNANTSRLFHEDHPPTQSEVPGTIPDAVSNGTIYGRKDGNWEAITVGSQFLPLAGGTMTGNLTIENAAPRIDLQDSDNAGNNLRFWQNSNNTKFSKLSDGGVVGDTFLELNDIGFEAFSQGNLAVLLTTLGLRVQTGFDLLIDDAPTLDNHGTRKDYVDGDFGWDGSKGHMVFPGGLILQWGRVSNISSAGATDTLSMTFPTASHMAFGTFFDTEPQGTVGSPVVTVSNTNITVSHTSTTIRSVSWLAIGY